MFGNTEIRSNCRCNDIWQKRFRKRPNIEQTVTNGSKVCCLSTDGEIPSFPVYMKITSNGCCHHKYMEICRNCGESIKPVAQTARNLPELNANRKTIEKIKDQSHDIAANETEERKTQPQLVKKEQKQNCDYSVRSANDVVCTCALMPSYEKICASKGWLESVICYAKLIKTFDEYQRLCKELRIRELLANLKVLQETYQQQLKTITQHKQAKSIDIYRKRIEDLLELAHGNTDRFTATLV